MIGREEFRTAVATMMDRAWREPGFCVPNQQTYPHQWLWDSCFHALIWASLGSDRGVTEVRSCLAKQHDDGFVPHMTYWSEPKAGFDFWGRSETSTITQPPMYGHAIAELARAGHDVPTELIDQATRGVLNLADRPRTSEGLVPVYHPWETGCDDSARWDDWVPDGAGDRVTRWREYKGEVVAELAQDRRPFLVGSIGFNALVAWNAVELLSVIPDRRRKDHRLVSVAQELTAAVAARWSGDRWVDDGPPSGRVRTLDAMSALLVDPRPEGFAALIDANAFGAPYGPRGVHRGESTYEPTIYWRGPAWPQLGYLMMVAARRAGETAVATELADRLVDGAIRSGLAEFWDPESGDGLGAIPQTWAGLGLVAMERRWRLGPTGG